MVRINGNPTDISKSTIQQNKDVFFIIVKSDTNEKWKKDFII